MDATLIAHQIVDMITVIIVNFNAGALLAECVESVLASSLPVKIIVSDNGSTDGSVAQLRHQFGGRANLTIIENRDNLGFAHANNIALQHAEGQYCLLLNPDCIVGTDTLEKMVRFMEAHPDAGMSGCLIRNVDGSEQAGCRRFIPTPWRSFVRVSKLNKLIKNHPRFQDFNMHGTPLPEGPVVVESISGAFMFVRMSAINKVGGLDEGYFLHCEDLDWCMRFRQQKYNIYFVPDVEITHVKGASGLVSAAFVEWHKHRGMVRFYKKFFRHQYPGVLMVGVYLLVWLRLFAKISYIACRQALNILAARDIAKQHQCTPSITSDPITGKENNSATGSENAPRIIVTGATSMIGHFLLPRLAASGYEVHAISRKEHKEHTEGAAGKHGSKIVWHVADISHPEQLPKMDAEAVVHLGPLWLLPPLLQGLKACGVKRVIGFGSTSLFSKANSADEAERAFVARLANAEKEISRSCAESGIHWTIFRPTLIYDCVRDKNITVIARFVRRYGFFPLVGGAKGLRQPIHADDLASACVTGLGNQAMYDRPYNLSGGETMTYREMIVRIFAALGKRPRFVSIPLGLFKVVILATKFLPSRRAWSGEMATRMNVDLKFDHDEAARDFDFHPRPLTLRFDNDL